MSVLSQESHSFTIVLQDVSAETLAIFLGIPIVDASIMWEPHLVRGTQ